MTEQDLEIQQLRQKIQKMTEEMDKLKNLHFLDQAEIVTLRRQIEWWEVQNSID